MSILNTETETLVEESNASTSQTTETDNVTVTDEPKAWYESLSEDTIKAEGFEGIKDKFKSVDDVALAYINAQKLIGKKSEGGLKLPEADADKSEWDEIYDKLGRPEGAGDYKMPEGLDISVDTELLTERNAALHELGLTQSQYEGIMGLYADEFSRISGTFQAQEAQVVKQSEQALKEEWGNKYDANIKQVANVAEKFGVKDTLIETGLINHLPVLQMLYKVSQSMNEDGIVKNPESKYSRADEIKQIRSSEAFLTRSHPDHQAAVDKLVKLYG